VTVDTTLMPSHTEVEGLDLDAEPPVHLRPIEEADIAEASRIAFEAFAGIADRHGFPRDFPTLESARELIGAFTKHPSIWGVVAVREGRVVGSNFLDERSAAVGVGPITVDPAAQASGVGRLLMEAVLVRGAAAHSVRLLQDSFNTTSLALYATLGFDVAEPVALVAGTPRGTDPTTVDVRPLVEDDLEACSQLCHSVHGFDRTAELRDALRMPGLDPVVGRRDGRLVAYATTLADFGLAHAVAETEDDLFGLVIGAITPDSPASFLLPLRQHDLVRRLLAAGLRMVKPMTYMVAGPYRRPLGAWIPSVLY
jgi:predicted N-acetyltransferase YhbS